MCILSKISLIFWNFEALYPFCALGYSVFKGRKDLLIFNSFKQIIFFIKINYRFLLKNIAGMCHIKHYLLKFRRIQACFVRLRINYNDIFSFPVESNLAYMSFVLVLFLDANNTWKYGVSTVALNIRNINLEKHVYYCILIAIHDRKSLVKFQ